MIRNNVFESLRRALLCATILSISAALPAHADDDGDDDDAPSAVASVPLPTGQLITPTAPRGANFQPLNPHLADLPDFTADHATTLALSPDQKTLLILTSGYNLNANKTGGLDASASNEYVFVYDVSGRDPVQKQAIQLPTTFGGLTFSPDGSQFYVSGGESDTIHSFALTGGSWSESGTPIALGHTSGNGFGNSTGPTAAGIATTADGKRLVVANYNNDSVSIVDLASRKVTGEADMRPGIIDSLFTGQPGGEYPYWVAIKGNDVAYVSSLRDREIVVLSLTGAKPTVAGRIKVNGNPNRMLLNKAQNRLFVAVDNADQVLVINTETNRVVRQIRTAAPEGLLSQPEAYRGASPNSLALSPDESRLYVTNGGSNSVAVIALDRADEPVVGLIPTGWDPNAVSVGKNGSQLYVVNAKSKPGPNPAYCYGNSPNAAECRAHNQYVYQLEKAGFQTLPTPTDEELENLTRQVAANNRYDVAPNGNDFAVMQALRQRIRHIIYVVKENRTYDQILGDLPKGNGDSSLTEFGQKVTPNQHQLANEFATIDNYRVSSEVSGDGYQWVMAAHETDIGMKTIAMNYSGKLPNYDTEGQNRNVDVGIATLAGRLAATPDLQHDPNLLPGTNDVSSPDGPDGQPQRGFIWDAVLRAGLSVRNYGYYCDESRYGGSSSPIPLDRTPAQDHLVVSFPTNPTLVNHTDPYFRSFDNAFPDYWREAEWEREFDQSVASGDLPNLELVRLMHDHMGSFGTAIDGVDTPETQLADNDYALGKLIEKVAHSPFKDSTLIIVLEDDAQDGPDHVDAHRSVLWVAGPYVKHHALVHTTYTTPNVLRTIEDILGVDHLSLNDAYQRPMTEVFDLSQRDWTFTAQPSTALRQTTLPIKFTTASAADDVKSTHDAAYWAEKTAGMNFAQEDKADPAKFNELLWEGLMGGRPYPVERSGADLSRNRVSLLQRASLRTTTGSANDEPPSVR